MVASWFHGPDDIHSISARTPTLRRLINARELWHTFVLTFGLFYLDTFGSMAVIVRLVDCNGICIHSGGI